MHFPKLNFEGKRLLIVGDIMLDQYYFGETARISPEAPVPIVKMMRSEDRPGGAANVAMNVSALGAEVQLLGLVGDDEAANKLAMLLKPHGILHHLLPVSSRATITKLRVISRNQQIIRLDTEKTFTMEHSLSLQMRYKAILEQVDAVILSDYGKGTLACIPDLIREARARDVPVIVDPKSTDFNLYRGATVVTPNLKELEAVCGSCENLNELVEKSKTILEQFEISNLVVTRSEKGISVISRVESPHHIPALAREVHDVTGAGDTVVAVLGACLAADFDLIEAATLGNVAAGIVVSKLGTSTVSVKELETDFHLKY